WVREGGIEPPRPKAQVPKTCASACSATPAGAHCSLVHPPYPHEVCAVIARPGDIWAGSGCHRDRPWRGIGILARATRTPVLRNALNIRYSANLGGVREQLPGHTTLVKEVSQGARARHPLDKEQLLGRRQQIADLHLLAGAFDHEVPTVEDLPPTARETVVVVPFFRILIEVPLRQIKFGGAIGDRGDPPLQFSQETGVNLV